MGMQWQQGREQSSPVGAKRLWTFHRLGGMRGAYARTHALGTKAPQQLVGPSGSPPQQVGLFRHGESGAGVSAPMWAPVVTMAVGCPNTCVRPYWRKKILNLVSVPGLQSRSVLSDCTSEAARQAGVGSSWQPSHFAFVHDVEPQGADRSCSARASRMRKPWYLHQFSFRP